MASSQIQYSDHLRVAQVRQHFGLNQSDMARRLDAAPHDGLDLLLTCFPGFFMYARLLEQLAEGIATGEIEVPPSH